MLHLACAFRAVRCAADRFLACTALDTAQLAHGLARLGPELVTPRLMGCFEVGPWARQGAGTACLGTLTSHTGGPAVCLHASSYCRASKL